ncbi:MAG: HAD hydrolase-like protein [Spirochaetota bacterium]
MKKTFNSYDVYIFDLDGTLTDSSQGITQGIRRMLDYLDIEISAEGLTEWIGPPIKQRLTHEYGIGLQQIDEAIAVFRSYYSKQGYRENRLYPGVRELLRTLREQGKQTLIATSKPEQHAMQVLTHFDLLHMFDFIGTNTDDNMRPTKTDVLAHVLEAADISRQARAVMIGDRSFDTCGARECSIDAVGVLYGFGSPEEFDHCPPKALVEHPEDLLPLLCGERVYS